MNYKIFFAIIVVVISSMNCAAHNGFFDPKYNDAYDEAYDSPHDNSFDNSYDNSYDNSFGGDLNSDGTPVCGE